MTISPIAIPLIFTSAGPQPTPPDTLRAAVSNAVAAVVPDYTANLPGTLIEDLLSTEMGALTTMDQGRVDSVACLSPVGMSPSVLAMLGQQEGLPQGVPTNTSVPVTFTGTAGFLIPAGEIVGDGTHQYVLQNPTPILSTGQSAPAYCVATQSGSWAVPIGSVTTVITPVPVDYTLSCTNATAGTPGGAAESVQSYRARLLQAQTASAQGFRAYLLTLLQSVSGVIALQTDVVQVYDGWKVIVGGGDPVAVATAIYLSTAQIDSLRGSFIASRTQTVSIIDAPNSIEIPFVIPPQQVVTMTVTIQTDLQNFANMPQVQQLAQPALAGVVNGTTVGQPISRMSLDQALLSAISSILPASNIASITYLVGITTANGSQFINNPQLIPSDPESYFYTTASSITVQ